MWGSGLWTPSIQLQRRLRGQELRWLRRTLCKGPKPIAKDWVEWFRETQQEAYMRTRDARLPLVHQRFCTAVFGWWGHVARRKNSNYGPACWMEWKNPRWFGTCQLLGEGTRGSDWRHPSTNWAKQADWFLFKWDPEWESKAQQRHHWRSLMWSWLSFCRKKWKSPALTRRKEGWNSTDNPPVKQSVLWEHKRLLHETENRRKKRRRV